MDPLTQAALITGGVEIASNYFGSKSNERAAKKNAELQREFAQNGISWRVADAKRAGISPLAALGMSPAEATPVHIGDDPGQGFREMSRKLYDAELQSKVQDTKGTMLDNENKLLDLKIKSQEWEKLKHERNMRLSIGTANVEQLYRPFYDRYSKKIVYLPHDDALLA